MVGVGSQSLSLLEEQKVVIVRFSIAAPATWRIGECHCNRCEPAQDCEFGAVDSVIESVLSFCGCVYNVGVLTLQALVTWRAAQVSAILSG